jgi:hypothetical protein
MGGPADGRLYAVPSHKIEFRVAVATPLRMMAQVDPGQLNEAPLFKCAVYAIFDTVGFYVGTREG